jgi:hypothetical protein
VRQMMHAWQAPMRVSKLSLTSLLWLLSISLIP